MSETYEEEAFRLAMVAVQFSNGEIPEEKHFNKAHFAIIGAARYIEKDELKKSERRVSAMQLQECMWKKKSTFQENWVEACRDGIFGEYHPAMLYSMAGINNDGSPLNRWDAFFCAYKNRMIPESLARQFISWAKRSGGKKPHPDALESFEKLLP